MALETRRTAFGKVEFNRPPRVQRSLSQMSLELPKPPESASRAGGSPIAMLVVPLVATVSTSGIFILFALSMPSEQRGLMIVAGAAMMIGSTLPVAWLYSEDRWRGRQEKQTFLLRLGLAD